MKASLPHNVEIILINGGINWTWYCHVILNDDMTCKVLREYRLHDFDEYQGAGKHPKTIGNYQIKENSLDDSRIQGRIALGVWVNDILYSLKEPVKRWSFGK